MKKLSKEMENTLFKLRKSGGTIDASNTERTLSALERRGLVKSSLGRRLFSFEYTLTETGIVEADKEVNRRERITRSVTDAHRQTK